MGIRGLETYLERHCPDGAQPVKIPELIKRFGNRQTTIVVDGPGCIRILYGDLEWVGGGQLKQFVDKAKHFVNAFEEIGVHLVFFFDGPTECKKRKTWVTRRKESQKKVYKVLDVISSGQQSTKINRSEIFLLPPGMGQLCRIVFQEICGCEVYQSLGECDEEIAEYARRHGAFAILGQDTDFVILDGGGALYLSMKHLDLHTMTTRLYDPEALARRLGLFPSQLPLLATLIGNDVIPFDDLRKFHSRISNTKNYIGFDRLFPNVARFIQKLPRNESDLLSELPEISQFVFGNQFRNEDILTSIHSYRASSNRDYDREDRENSRDSKWINLVKEARDRHVENKIPGMIYAVMKGLPFETSTIIEDDRKDDLPLFAVVTLPLRKRLYGILLQEKRIRPGEVHEIEEWCMAGMNSLKGPEYVTADLPAKRHPGLRALWSDDERWANKRWELLVTCVSSDLNVQQLRSLPPYLVVPTLIIHHLYNSCHLEEYEVDAVLATAAVIKHYDSGRLAELPADPLLNRGVRLASLYMRITFIMYIIIAACGYPLSIRETSPWMFFDGKLFQSKYVAACNKASHERLCEHKVDVLEHFQMARAVLIPDVQ